MINTGGLKVFPAEVERVLLEQPGVAAAAVVGAPDERLGEVPVAFLVLKEGAELDEAGLRRACEERLSGYKVPRRLERLEALPANSAGKVQKFLLRELAARAPAQSRRSEAGP